MTTSESSDIPLVNIGITDIREAHRLSEQQAWPHRPEDWQFLLETSQAIGAVCDGKLVGTAVLTPYGDAAAVCNMIIVDQAFRGLGLGRRLVERLLTTAGSRECRLVATLSGLPLYEKLGFVATGQIWQHQGVVKAMHTTAKVVDATATADLADVIALDTAALGLDRTALMTKLIEEKPFVLVRDEHGLRGFASCRCFGRGVILGPIVARDDESFRTLLEASIARHQGRFLRVDLTDAASTGIALVKEAGLVGVGGGIAMTRPGSQRPSSAAGACVYALASQAFC
ncbi:uncharacterized protein E0L32_012235 [Thyridium curvatum]|uniref:N-acetyltransferase domain-containing protein n=1 Tax=Thyridium curvatum TaxID=1093900 RepID=A0A507BBM5_9PEZI|nr:uncharacterized protein E0L32_012235 [Thyridium curvatum]TPX17297.1 hypothetical protein E0L32_012235 [Thyridium curvatum]